MTSRSPTLGLLFVAAILATVASAFWPTVAALSTRYDTYRHIGVVFAAFAVIVWLLRWELSILPVRPFWPGLAAMMGAGIVWLAGELLFVRVLTDIAVVAMVAATVLTVLGYRWLWTLTFPLTFLLFAIPMGGPLVPTLVDWTAKFAVIGLQSTGVPIHQEGAFFIIPSGSWSIVEACSGIGYFSTCVMLGCLYAWTMFRSFLRRIVFIAGAAVIGIIGNWIRVYLTVLIAHLSDNRLLRDDHSAFGWGVFAVLAIAYCWFGLSFRDDELKDNVAGHSIPEASGLESARRKPASRLRGLMATAAVLATLAIWPLIQFALKGDHQLRVTEVADIQPQRGWSIADKSFTNWTPELQNPSRTRIQVFDKGGQRVGVFIGIFRNQNWTSKLVTSVNQLASDDNPDWKLYVRGVAQTEFSGRPLVVDTGVLDGREGRIAVWRWYWINGVATANGSLAKAYQMLARFRGSDDISAWVAIFSEATALSGAATSKHEEFMRDMGGSLEQALRVTTQQ